MSNAINALPKHLRIGLGASWLEARQVRNPKYRVANRKVLNHLRTLLRGNWQKVIKKGPTGDVHYFEHASGQVAGVKFFES